MKPDLEAVDESNNNSKKLCTCQITSDLNVAIFALLRSDMHSFLYQIVSICFSSAAIQLIILIRE
jgi:hypothetical protein